jgi:hypothetical protein
VGSDSPEPTSVELATVGKYPTVSNGPDEEETDYSEMSDDWKAAYDHAASHNNPVKSAILYADAHERDHEVAQKTPDQIKAEIERLQAELETR